jgi:L-cysteate sulfo-lyase
MTAAAAARLGLACHLVLTRGLHPEPQGNLLLDRLLGATVHLMEESDPDAARRAMDCLADELRRDGHTPFIVPLGGSTPQGALGYAAMVDELLTQLEAAVIRATHLYAVSGSCGMQAGILAGLIAAESPIVVQGISVSHPREQLEPQARDLTVQTLQRLGLEETVPPEKVLIDDRYVGPDYGIPTPGMIEALEIVARDEGVILDPVYTGKAMAGLIDHARQGLVGADDTVVFLHSGGLPGLFAYAQEFDRQLGAMPALTR